jgi:hypothetical protein
MKASQSKSVSQRDSGTHQFQAPFGVGGACACRNAEIASVLGISENNVAVRMNRARKLLLERLGNSR